MGIYILGTGPSNSECCGCAGRPNPCDGPEAAVLYGRISEASLSKCGWTEFGTASSPPKYYLIKTLSGGFTQLRYATDSSCSNCVGGEVVTYSGSCTYSDLTNPVACSLNTATETSSDFLDTDCSTVSSSATGAPGCEIYIPFSGAFTESSTSTQRTVQGNNTCTDIPGQGYQIWSGSAYETLSDEYTTSELSDNVTSNLPAFSGTYSTPFTSAAAYDISSDETTIFKTRIQYKFELPSLTGYSCFQLTWSEKFTPDTGSPVYTSFTYNWNGTDTETPVYEISVPTYVGETTVVSVAQNCICS